MGAWTEQFHLILGDGEFETREFRIIGIEVYGTTIADTRFGIEEIFRLDHLCLGK